VGFPPLSWNWKRYRLRATACGIGNGRGRRVPGFGRCSALLVAFLSTWDFVVAGNIRGEAPCAVPRNHEETRPWNRRNDACQKWKVYHGGELIGIWSTDATVQHFSALDLLPKRKSCFVVQRRSMHARPPAPSVSLVPATPSIFKRVYCMYDFFKAY
jgi:hypothetical protein